MARFNPFRPNNIVIPGMFAGRVEELLLLDKVLVQTRGENPCHFLIEGERGIGKSSLLLYIQLIAAGSITSLDDQTFNFITVNVGLEASNTYTDIIHKIGAELQKAVVRHCEIKAIASSVWDFLKQFKICGVEYKDTEKDEKPHSLLEELTYALVDTCKQLADPIDGVLITIDEADKPSPKANLGEFLKLLTEKLTKLSCHKVALGLAGLPIIIRNLRESHESSVRLFQDITLKPLLPQERVDVILKGLAEAKEKNGFETRITEDAKEWISSFSEGYPHFIQQYAYSAFDADTDNVIDRSDVLHGTHQANGAIHQLGTRYFHDWYFDQIASDQYRAVLQAMAAHNDEWVTKDTIRKAVTIKPHILDNAINALKNRHIIVAQEGKKGHYRLPNKSFAVWIKGFTQGRIQ